MDRRIWIDKTSSVFIRETELAKWKSQIPHKTATKKENKGLCGATPRDTFHNSPGLSGTNWKWTTKYLLAIPVDDIMALLSVHPGNHQLWKRCEELGILERSLTTPKHEFRESGGGERDWLRLKPGWNILSPGISRWKLSQVIPAADVRHEHCAAAAPALSPTDIVEIVHGKAWNANGGAKLILDVHLFTLPHGSLVDKSKPAASVD